MRVLIIIVTYNATQWLERCLQSALKASCTAISTDVFVIDNCSTDGTADVIDKHYPTVKLLRNTQNSGFGAANNIGLEYALSQGYDYAYLLNQDAWLCNNALSMLVEAAQAKSEYAILSPLQMSADGVSFDPNFEKRAVPRNMPSCEVYEVRRVMAAHWLVRLSSLKEVGLFAPLFPHYGEDDNLCDRLRHKGWKIGVFSGAKAIHDRAFRRESVDALIHRNYYIKSLVELANPCRSFWSAKLFVFVYTFVKAVKYRSLEPFRYFGKIKRRLLVIRLTREL